MPSQMNGSSASYSSIAELKNSQTCRCSRSMDRPKGMGSVVEFMSPPDSIFLRFSSSGGKALSSLQAVSDLDGEPIQRSMIELALYLRFVKVRCEHAPEAAVAADERRRLCGSNAAGTQHIELARAYKEVARRDVFDKHTHALRERGGACGVSVAAHDAEKGQGFARESAAGNNCQTVGSFVEALQRAHVGARYANRDIEDLPQVRTDILGSSQPLQKRADLLPSCGVERLREVCRRLAPRTGPHCRGRAMPKM